VCARAWTDPAYRARLLKDATPAISELGYAAVRANISWRWRTPLLCTTGRVHAVLPVTPGRYSGLPPVWYESAPYRSKAVKDPRGVLKDFGFELPRRHRHSVWDRPRNSLSGAADAPRAPMAGAKNA